jgi:hypothetical protein
VQHTEVPSVINYYGTKIFLLQKIVASILKVLPNSELELKEAFSQKPTIYTMGYGVQCTLSTTRVGKMTKLILFPHYIYIKAKKQ